MTDQIVVFAVFLPIYLKYGKNLGEILCVIGRIGSLLGRPIHISDCRSTDLILLETVLETGLFYYYCMYQHFYYFLKSVGKCTYDRCALM